MNYQSLIYFKTIAELQHFTHAAEKLYITQPALSKAIRNLEADLGCCLFQKAGRNVVLTKYGQCFYEYVNRSVEEINAGIEAVKHMVNTEKSTICISAMFSMHSLFLPNCIFRFRQEQPQCRVMLEHKFSTAVLDDMLKHRCDLGICSNFPLEGGFSTLDRVQLFQERLCLIVSKHHPFSKRSTVTVDELRDEPFIAYKWSKLGINQILLQICAERGFEPTIRAEGFNDYGVFGMVASGEGIAIVAAADAVSNDSVSRIDIITDVPMTRSIFLVWRKDEVLPPLVDSFRKMLISEASKLPPIIH